MDKKNKKVKSFPLYSKVVRIGARLFNNKQYNRAE